MSLDGRLIVTVLMPDDGEPEQTMYLLNTDHWWFFDGECWLNGLELVREADAK